MNKLKILLVILLLSSCSWRSPNAEFYVMNSNGINALSENSLNVAVARVKVPDMLDRAQMVVYENNTDRVDILEFHRWVEVLPDILQSTVVNDLQALLPNSYIKRTYFDSDKAKYNVSIEINQIKAYRNDKVVLSAWWNIANKNGNIIKRKQSSFEAAVHGDSMQDLVNAESQVIHEMSKEIAQNLLKL